MPQMQIIELLKNNFYYQQDRFHFDVDSHNTELLFELKRKRFRYLDRWRDDYGRSIYHYCYSYCHFYHNDHLGLKQKIAEAYLGRSPQQKKRNAYFLCFLFSLECLTYSFKWYLISIA